MYVRSSGLIMHVSRRHGLGWLPGRDGGREMSAIIFDTQPDGLVRRGIGLARLEQ